MKLKDGEKLYVSVNYKANGRVNNKKIIIGGLDVS